MIKNFFNLFQTLKSFLLLYPAVLLIFIFTLLNIAAGTQLGLSVDAAHYALYGQHLAWSYFDHPPLIGWLQAVALLFGKTDSLMRIWAWIFSLGTVLSLCYIARRLTKNFSPQLVTNCILLYYSAFILNLLAIDLLPQNLLLFFGLWSVYSLYHAVQQPHRLKYWSFLGLFLGLASLSEYTAFLLSAGMLVYLLIYYPNLFLKLKPYSAVLFCLLGWVPIILWNVNHDWISWRYQLHHGFNSMHWNGMRFCTSLGIQLIVYGWTLFIVGIVSVVYYLIYYKNFESITVFIFSALPILLLFLWSGGYHLILPHWPALAWLLLIPVTADYITRHKKLWVKFIVMFSFFWTMAIYIFLYGLVFFNPSIVYIKKNPLRDLYGWESAARHAQAWIKKQSTMNNKPPQLFVNSWELASRLAWYSQMPVQVADNSALNQFDLWYGRPSRDSRGILVVPLNGKKPLKQSKHSGDFSYCTKLDSLPIFIKGHLVNQFDFYYCGYFNPHD